MDETKITHAQINAFFYFARRTFPCILGVFGVATAPSGLAVEEKDKTVAVELGPIVVSATRTEKHLEEIPASVDVVTRNQFEEQQSQAVSTVLQQLPGVDFGGGARPEGQIPIIRGTTGKQITLMVDGARRNEGGTIMSPLLIDPDLLAVTEVVRGPTSSLYGPGGLGGIMAFRTLSANDLLDEGENFGTHIKGRYASANQGQNYHGQVFGRAGGFDGLMAFGYRNWDRIRQGGGDLLEPNDGDLRSGLAKVGWQTDDERLRLEASYQIYDMDNLRPNNPQAGTDFPFVQQHHDKQQQATFHLDTRDAKGRKAWQGKFYWTALKREADPNWDTMPPLDATFTETDTIGANLLHTSRIGLGPFGHHQLTYGVDFYRDKQSAGSGGSPNPVIPDGKQRVFGGFVQDEIDLRYGWSLIPSFRWDHYHTAMDEGDNPERNDSRFSPKVALQWQAKPWLSLYASYGESFRAPSISEMYQQLSGNNFFTNFVSNPDLRPEVARTEEFGFRFDYPGVLAADDRLHFYGTFYQMRIDDLIQSKIVGFFEHPTLGNRPILQYQNVNRARRRGMELEAGYGFGDLDLNLIYSRMRTEDRNTGENLFSPPDKFVGKVRYWVREVDLSLLWISTWVGGQHYDATELRRRDDYNVHDLFLVWQPIRSLKVDFGVTNLFDQGYAPYFSENNFTKVKEEGRSYKITVGMRF
ncbi:MAG: TonB-dependent hemoglobin/transferrin/lactoferrin family receptor [Methylohalobius sp. ZOD2]|nr:TonB-dependent hemoglobin/transferrin/lactoferrin family receptor [Methylothermaceae bacterium]